MNAVTVFARMVPVDLKNLRRDPMLAWMPVVPIVVALLIRWGVPLATELASNAAGIDIRPWYPLFMSGFAVMMPGLVGVAVGFLLLDERDEGVLDALLVTPLPEWAYLGYRSCLPLLVGIVMTLVAYPMAGLVPLPFGHLAAAAVLGGFGAPFMALLLATCADNKVTGFAIMKLLNALQILPLLAYFVREPWQYLAGLWPGYWPMKIVWLAAAGEAITWQLRVGLAVNIAAVGLLLMRYRRVVRG